MTQIFLVSTLFGAITVSAAMDAGQFGPPDRRRMLLVSNTGALPEMSTPVHRAPGFAALASRWDEIRYWNDEIAPLHPSGWEPRQEDQPLLERWLRDRWGLGDEPVELVVESIAVPPSRALAQIFFDAEITVYSDGLMSYGPTRNALPYGIGTQITRQLHLDLVPGLEPQLLREHGVPAQTIPDESFRAVLDKVRAEIAPILDEQFPDPPADGGEVALIVGQYLAALDILTPREEDELHLRMLRGAVARGHRTVLFKPHPAAPATVSTRLAAEADRLGARLVVIDAPVPAETWCATVRPGLIVGCFSTSLVTAARYYGVPAAAVGATELLDRLAPYENSNRIPVTIIEATLPTLKADGTLTDPWIGQDRIESELAPLVATVAYCMRASARPELRATAIDYLERNGGGRARRYFKRRRLTALGLPGGVAQSHPWVLNAVLPRSSRRRQFAVSVLRQTEKLKGKESGT
ncbi:alpha-2,8-polysialyltransferase family protein [Thermomonospora cellulosilytica]|uniref:Capsule polysaccharide biosynthesis protein n=1 Tax=Thermomonospora cellulosilytica TaxID=1411118 RepID=A0A7W3N5P5_9ACTN|nr:alpha-2,8-polysialyltransferase family protein [Thermomonospora cellulosilytica]MBA9007956.1 hypothetical protein [Thermomonospora cellulosilytica]